jgi:hypothetical protein
MCLVSHVFNVTYVFSGTYVISVTYVFSGTYVISVTCTYVFRSHVCLVLRRWWVLHMRLTLRMRRYNGELKQGIFKDKLL